MWTKQLIKIWPFLGYHFRAHFKYFMCTKGIVLKKKELLKIYSPSRNPRCKWVCFSLLDLEKCSIPSLAHHWILCSEWVPSEWESRSQKRWFKVKMREWWICSLQTCSFCLLKILADGLEWCGLVVDYCDVFISCLDSHSDGTHSLQSIHWWASDAMTHFYKSDEETNSSKSSISQRWVIFFLANFYFWGTIPLVHTK